MAQTDIETLELLPMKLATNSEQVKLGLIVDQILAAKKRDPKADTTAWEREIDRLVYKLYDLTPDEIAIVEESTRAK